MSISWQKGRMKRQGILFGYPEYAGLPERGSTFHERGAEDMAITKILNIQAADDRNPATHLKNAIEYIQNPDKTEECVLVGSINCLPDTAFEQMMETKELYHKKGKRQGYHIIISFSPEEVVTPEQALYVVEHFAKDVLGADYEAVYTVHTDKEHMHAHLIWNSVSLVTGKKYNSHII